MHGPLNVKLKFTSIILKNRELLFYSYLYWITTKYSYINNNTDTFTSPFDRIISRIRNNCL